VGIQLRPPVTAPFTVYSEEHLREAIRTVNGDITGFRGQKVPLGIFLNDIWQSAKREGFIEGYTHERKGLYTDLYGHEPPAGLIRQWRKQAAKKAMSGDADDVV
jgi:hypothetical protein